jgi:hypothetical protein
MVYNRDFLQWSPERSTELECHLASDVNQQASLIHLDGSLLAVHTELLSHFMLENERVTIKMTDQAIATIGCFRTQQNLWLKREDLRDGTMVLYTVCERSRVPEWTVHLYRRGMVSITTIAVLQKVLRRTFVMAQLCHSNDFGLL